MSSVSVVSGSGTDDALDHADLVRGVDNDNRDDQGGDDGVHVHGVSPNVGVWPVRRTCTACAFQQRTTGTTFGSEKAYRPL